jgi:hypothetical protein
LSESWEGSYCARVAASAPTTVSKLKKVEEEADETGFWIDQLLIIGLSASITARAKRIANLSEEVTALTVAAIKTCRARVSYSRHKLPS